jgi:hypothetical protein
MTAGAAAPARGWIESPRFDAVAFLGAPLAGVLAGAIATQVPGRAGSGLILLLTYFVGIPHYLSSFTFFLGDDTLAYYRTRRAAFFAGPAVLFALVVALRALHVDGPVLVAMFLWNIWHVSLQSAGILGIYRRLGGGDPAERRASHLLLLGTGATLALWHLDRFPPLHDPVVALWPGAPAALRVALVALTLAALAAYLWRLARRARRPGAAELGFLAASLLLFHPYAWVEDANLATFAMLLGHFVQYLAIVWLVHRRKYAGQGGSARQQWLGWVSARPARVAVVLAVAGATFLAADRLARAAGAPMVYIAVWNALTLVHFYLDGLIWAFRRREVRDTLGRALMPPERALAA